MVRFINKEVAMSAIRAQLINYINEIPDYKLESITPLLKMLHDDTVFIEKISFEDLSVEDKEDVLQARKDLESGNTFSLSSVVQ